MGWSYIVTIIKEHKRDLLFANMVAIIAVLVSIPIALLMPLLIDEVILHKSSTMVDVVNQMIGVSQPETYVGIILFLAVMLRFLFFLFSVLQTKLFTKISKNVTYRIRKKILAHLEVLSMNEYDKQKSGYVVSVLLTEVDTIDTFLTHAVSRFVISLLTLIGVSVVLLMIHWQLALFILFLNPIVILITTKFAHKISYLKKDENSAYKAFTEALSETVELFSHIKAANREKEYIDAIRTRADALKSKSIKFGYKSEAYSKFSYFFFLSGFELFRAASILTVIYSDLSIGLMLAIFGYLWVMMGPIQDILSMQYSFANASRALGVIDGFLTLETEKKHDHQLDPFASSDTVAIELENLRFGYNDKLILNGVNLKIAKGEKVAIAGASGAGKSTLAKLMIGFYSPLNGAILYNGVPYQKIGNSVIREHVVMVDQMPLLFNDSLRMNLTLGREIEDEKLLEVLYRVELGALYESLEDGLETVLGKHGVKFSGGQRQRVAIARALLQNPKVVIFDESTSALDAKTEASVVRAIEELLSGKTSIIIAHRQTTLNSADRVYTLENGMIN
jgi:ATP-binding cassette subfamily C protein